MKIAIIVSKNCPAGNNVKDCLLKILGIHDDVRDKNDDEYNKNIINKIIDINKNTKLYVINKTHVYAENLDEEIHAELFIFATTHKSEHGSPSLSIHTPGNWGKADMGGKDKQLCLAPAFFLKEAMMMLEKTNNINFEVIQECTHHGPFMKKPCMFIEIGSTEKEWGNKEAGMVNAKVINYLISNADEIENKKYKSAFGIGGLHHTPNFKKIILNTQVALGHVCPKYNLENLSKDMLEQAMGRTFPEAEFVFVDWKGLGGFKSRVKNLLETNNVVYKKTKNF